MPSNAELTAQVAEITTRVETAEARVATLADDLTQANARADGEATRRQEAEKLSDTLTAEVATLMSSLRAYKGSATKARNEVVVLKAELSPEARVIGAMKPARSDEEALLRQNRLDHAFANGLTQILFSDGKRELRELAPLIVDAGAWLVTPHGRVLDHEPLLEPGDCPRGELPIAGFALLDEAGEQVAYHALPERIVVASGTRVQIPRGCIRF